MKIVLFAAVILCSGLFSVVHAEDLPADIQLPAKENFHLFLLAGQSNMAGRGKVTPADKEPHPRVLALNKEGDWQPAVDPLHFDKPIAGVGVGRSFAIQLAEQDENIVIGLIPAACGGSPISSWEPGGYHAQTKSHPYDDAIKRMRMALQAGTFKGILWHQGESDCKPDLAPVYQQKLAALIQRFRTEFKESELPFLIGQLGQFPQSPWSEQKKQVNQAHIMISKELPLVGFIPSDELTCKSDNVHFDANSLRTFGKRYAAGYLKLVGQE